MKNLPLLSLGLILPAAALAADPVGGWRRLLDDKLTQFDVYLSYPGTVISDVVAKKAPPDLKPLGMNPPGQKVISVVKQDGKPVLRISGEIYGCAVTKSSFSNYHLRLDTRWGGKKWVPRLDEPKDSGILYHSRGEFGVDYWKSWALSQEFQVIEHGLGEYWTQASSAMDIRADPGKPGAPGSDAPRWNSVRRVCWGISASRSSRVLTSTSTGRRRRCWRSSKGAIRCRGSYRPTSRASSPPCRSAGTAPAPRERRGRATRRW